MFISFVRKKLESDIAFIGLITELLKAYFLNSSFIIYLIESGYWIIIMLIKVCVINLTRFSLLDKGSFYSYYYNLIFKKR